MTASYKQTTQLPAKLADINRVDSIKILRVTVTNSLIMNEHADRVYYCSQYLSALKTMQAHGLNRECLHIVFRVVILEKLTYAVNT